LLKAYVRIELLHLVLGLTAFLVLLSFKAHSDDSYGPEIAPYLYELVAEQDEGTPYYQNYRTEPLEVRYTMSTIHLAEQIIKWKKRVDHSIWFECGVKLDEAAARKSAYEWAEAILDGRRKGSYTLNGEERLVDLQEVVGTMINESRFDRCALGPHVRKYAYKKGVLKKKEGQFSHTMEELEYLFNHRLMQGRLADIGPGQIVVAIGRDVKYRNAQYRGMRWEEAQEYFNVHSGVEIVFKEMARRAERCKTHNPSSRWPGSSNHYYYTTMALQHSRSLFK
jgi:hypothetical protein